MEDCPGPAPSTPEHFSKGGGAPCCCETAFHKQICRQKWAMQESGALSLPLRHFLSYNHGFLFEGRWGVDFTPEPAALTRT